MGCHTLPAPRRLFRQTKLTIPTYPVPTAVPTNFCRFVSPEIRNIPTGTSTAVVDSRGNRIEASVRRRPFADISITDEAGADRAEDPVPEGVGLAGRREPPHQALRKPLVRAVAQRPMV